MLVVMLRQTLIIICISLTAICCSDEKPRIKETTPTKTNIDTLNYVDFKYSKVNAFATVKPFDYIQLYFDKKIDLSKFGDTINRTLNEFQTKYLCDLLSGKYNTDTATTRIVADCFYPRHNIIFLNDKDSVVNYLSVCFECNIVKGSKGHKASMQNLSDFFNSLGLKVFDRPDYYKSYYDSLAKIKHIH
jgi:hypothetical protein